MKVEVPNGKYVLAVSGGVDSMVLLDILAKQKQVTGDRLRVTDKKKSNSNLQPTTSKLELVVAHFNHNIREDSIKDEELVRDSAAEYGLAFEAGYGEQEKGASEEAAREARYDFLRKVQIEHKATKIITAHHQDDIIETAFINILRGTDRRGLTAIMNSRLVIRPMLKRSKAEILKYAQDNKLKWREDVTNQDTRYLRNYLRLNILPKMDNIQRGRLIKNLEKVAKTNNKIDDEIATISHHIGEDIDRRQFAGLPTSISNELLAYRLRLAEAGDFDSKTINRLNVAIKVSRPNSVHHIKQSSKLKMTAKTASFVTP